MSAPGKPMLELTIRGVILGVLITLVFTAANVYLGLRVGLTFATSIPAAVISMAVLSLFKDLDHPREQHRADRRLRGAHLVGDHLRPPRPSDRGLVGGLSVLDLVLDLRLGRHIGRAVHDPLAPRAGDDLRSSVPGRCRRGRGARGRRGRAPPGRRGIARGPACRRLRRGRCGRNLAIVASTGYATGASSPSSSCPRPAGTSRWRGERLRHGLRARAARPRAISWDCPSARRRCCSASSSPGVSRCRGLRRIRSPCRTIPSRPGAIDDYGQASSGPSRCAFIGAGAIAVASVWTLLKLIGPVVSGVVSTLSASRAAASDTGDLTDTDISRRAGSASWRSPLPRRHRLAAFRFPAADAACPATRSSWCWPPCPSSSSAAS